MITGLYPSQFGISFSLEADWGHFQMLHPYIDGNGRLGRLILSAKMGSQRGWFFKFHLSDGPTHLHIMMDMPVESLAKLVSHIHLWCESHSAGKKRT